MSRNRDVDETETPTGILFTVTRDGEAIAVLPARNAVEACRIVDSALAIDDARAIVERAGLSAEAVIGASLGNTAFGATLAARGATASEAAAWRQYGVAGWERGAAILML